MGEVLEHLYTAPSIVLKFIKSLMKQNGFLVLTTPNAVTITKRIALVLGRNPFEMIRDNHKNPGHFREYTKNELIGIGKDSGFEVAEVKIENYFRSDSKAVNFLYRLTSFRESLRNGIAIVYRKSELKQS